MSEQTVNPLPDNGGSKGSTSMATQPKTAARPPIEYFRTRLNSLLSSRFEGKYTLLAKRAQIPVSTMEHYMLHSKNLPGGDHINRMADALGVSTDFLLTGREAIRPSQLLSNAASLPIRTREGVTEYERHVAVPVFQATDLPLAADEVPDMDRAKSRVLVPVDMLPPKWYRLVAIQVTPAFTEYWKPGARLIVDWDNRKASWESLSLVKNGNRFAVGHLDPQGESFLFAAAGSDKPTILQAEHVTILGKVVVAITPV